MKGFISFIIVSIVAFTSYHREGWELSLAFGLWAIGILKILELTRDAAKFFMGQQSVTQPPALGQHAEHLKHTEDDKQKKRTLKLKRELEEKNLELLEEKQKLAIIKSRLTLDCKREKLQREKKEKELELKNSELVQEREQKEEIKKELEATKLKLEETISALVPIIPSDTISKEESPLAQGGYGVIYRGEWLGATIAIKELITLQFTHNAIVEFKEEAYKMARLRSPYVVTTYGITLNIQGQPKGIVMEYMPEGSLSTILHSKEIKLSWLVRHKMALAVAQGLFFLHQQNIIHNDLKSLNVLVHHYTDEWTLKLTDFGLSKIKEETARFTHTPQGTPAWMAPELFDKNAYSKASDVYAYGILLWEITSRKTPFKDLSFVQIIKQVVVHKERPSIATETPSLLAALMCSCWKQDQKERLPTEEVITKLEALPLKQELRNIDDKYNLEEDQRMDENIPTQWSMG